MIQITQLKLPIDHTMEMLEEKICHELKIKEKEILSWKILRRSVDARKKPILMYVYSVGVFVKNERKVLELSRRSRHNNIMSTLEKKYQLPARGTEPLKKSPIIIGCGPAGLFCGWLLAKMGYQPVILERGGSAIERKEQVDDFWQGKPLNPNCNVQFGEGGAGTFSDGKLNTSVKDPFGRNKKVLELFVEAGAPEEILYDQKPHLGTDLLITIITNLRKQIEEMGGTFHFHSQVTDLNISNGQIEGVQINHKQWIPTQVLIPAIGHSARDTFQMFLEKGIYMEPKAFAVGVRVEHLQSMINESQYGKRESEILGSASYKLTCQTASGHGVYSFCMCPGGYVVNASSEEGRLAVNGMSYHKRDSKNANSAIVVTISPSEYINYLDDKEKAEKNPLIGVEFQRKLETAAYDLGKGKIPVQTLEDFRNNKESTASGAWEPCMKGAYTYTNVRKIFPESIGDAIVEGMESFGHKIHGFDSPDTLLSGVESRTSSPVRISRDEYFLSNIKGIYPCGEGAGYAGGITSAAMDGLRIGEAVCEKYMKLNA